MVRRGEGCCRSPSSHIVVPLLLPSIPCHSLPPGEKNPTAPRCSAPLIRGSLPRPRTTRSRRRRTHGGHTTSRGSFSILGRSCKGYSTPVKMTSEGNKAVASSEPLTASSGAKRKRGRPRKYEYSTYEQPQMAQPIRSIPPLHSTLYNSNIRHDGLHITHTSGGTVDTKMHSVHVPPAQQTHGDRSTRPRDSGNTVKTQENQAFNYSTAPVQGNSGKDAIIGKHFVGKMAKQSHGFSLITVKVKDNHVLRGWVPDAHNLLPITPKDDLAPELPMLRPSQVQKKASAIHRQAPIPLPVRLEDVTIAKPLQMRRPVEKSTAKHIIPPTSIPYVGSGVVAAAPVSVKSGNAESACPEPSATAVPVKSAQPVLISCMHVDNQDVPVEGKSLPEVNSESQSSDGSKESSDNTEQSEANVLKEMDGSMTGASGQIQHVDQVATHDIEITSGSKEQSNPAISKQHISKEPSGCGSLFNTEQPEQPKTETNVLKEVDGSTAGASDDVQSVADENETKVDNK